MWWSRVVNEILLIKLRDICFNIVSRVKQLSILGCPSVSWFLCHTCKQVRHPEGSPRNKNEQCSKNHISAVFAKFHTANRLVIKLWFSAFRG